MARPKGWRAWRPNGWLVFAVFAVAFVPLPGTGIAWHTVIFFPIGFFLYWRYSQPHSRVARVMLKRHFRDIFGGRRQRRGLGDKDHSPNSSLKRTDQSLRD